MHLTTQHMLILMVVIDIKIVFFVTLVSHLAFRKCKTFLLPFPCELSSWRTEISFTLSVFFFALTYTIAIVWVKSHTKKRMKIFAYTFADGKVTCTWKSERKNPFSPFINVYMMKTETSSCRKSNNEKRKFLMKIL